MESDAGIRTRDDRELGDAERTIAARERMDAAVEAIDGNSVEQGGTKTELPVGLNATRAPSDVNGYVDGPLMPAKESSGPMPNELLTNTPLVWRR